MTNHEINMLVVARTGFGVNELSFKSNATKRSIIDARKKAMRVLSNRGVNKDRLCEIFETNISNVDVCLGVKKSYSDATVPAEMLARMNARRVEISGDEAFFARCREAGCVV